jgi:hypothetical protein
MAASFELDDRPPRSGAAISTSARQAAAAAKRDNRVPGRLAPDRHARNISIRQLFNRRHDVVRKIPPGVPQGFRRRCG